MSGYEENSRPFTVTGRGDEARIFRAAARHSRYVRFLRVAIPVVVVSSLGATALVAWFNPLKMLPRLPTEFGNIVVDGTKIRMDQLRIPGFTRDKRAYLLTARAASHDFTRADQVDLHDIDGTVELENNASMNVKAATGAFDSKNQILRLNDKVVLTTDAYVVHLAEAVVDVRQGRVVSEKPVRVNLLNGVLDANRLEVSRADAVLLFDGGVSMMLTLDQPKTTIAVTPIAPAAEAARR